MTPLDAPVPRKIHKLWDWMLVPAVLAWMPLEIIYAVVCTFWILSVAAISHAASRALSFFLCPLWLHHRHQETASASLADEDVGSEDPSVLADQKALAAPTPPDWTELAASDITRPSSAASGHSDDLSSKRHDRQIQAAMQEAEATFDEAPSTEFYKALEWGARTERCIPSAKVQPKDAAASTDIEPDSPSTWDGALPDPLSESIASPIFGCSFHHPLSEQGNGCNLFDSSVAPSTDSPQGRLPDAPGGVASLCNSLNKADPAPMELFAPPKASVQTHSSQSDPPPTTGTPGPLNTTPTFPNVAGSPSSIHTMEYQRASAPPRSSSPPSSPRRPGYTSMPAPFKAAPLLTKPSNYAGPLLTRKTTSDSVQPPSPSTSASPPASPRWPNNAARAGLGHRRTQSMTASPTRLPRKAKSGRLSLSGLWKRKAKDGEDKE